MYLDDKGFIVDKTGDGGDTANREGQWAYITEEDRGWHLSFVAPTYSCDWVRHPSQVPWNNPKNFTRDQATPLVAALGKTYFTNKIVFEHEALTIRSFFYSIIFRGGFMPNTERDVVGSTKYPWPHKFINDHGKEEFRWFDGPDIAGTPFLGTCIISGKIWAWYWLLPLCMLNLYLSVMLHSKDEDDSWQLAIMCDVYDQFFGTKYLKILAKRHDLEWAARKYFIENRDMPWFYDAWKMFLKKRGIEWSGSQPTSLG